MSVLTDSFLQALTSEYQWRVNHELGYALCGWQFQNKSIDCLAIDGENEEGEDVVELSYAYVSRYGITPRAELLFRAYCGATEKRIAYTHPNRIELSIPIEALDTDGDEIQPEDLHDRARKLGQHFFELVTAYEVCARQTEPDTRIPELYRKVLPSRQVAMIGNCHMAS